MGFLQPMQNLCFLAKNSQVIGFDCYHHFGRANKLAVKLIETIEKKGWCSCEGISRHQLFVHPDVSYTSHNSAMCFPAEINEQYLQDLIAHSAEFLVQNGADGSDPGLCVAVLIQSLTQNGSSSSANVQKKLC